jgi:hypothetical protein
VGRARDRRHGDIHNGLLPSLHRIDGDPSKRSKEMAKLYCLVAALAVFAPMAFATLSQAAQIVA